MLVTCVSDLHGFLPQLEGGDLLIVAGDLTARDDLQEHVRFQTWLHDQNYRKKVVIGGNHDNRFEKLGLISVRQQYEEMGEDYLCDSGTEFEGLKIWGSPHSLLFPGINPKCCAFTGTENDLKKKYDLIPLGIDILILHSAAYGILDENIYGEHCGSKSLLEAVQRIKPRLVVHGHIHEQGSKIKRVYL